MSAPASLIHDGAHILVSAGSADASKKFEQAALFPCAAVFDHDDGETILDSFADLYIPTEGNRFDVCCCAYCGQPTHALNDDEFEEGMFLSLQTYGGADDFLTELVSLGRYICPTCCLEHSTDLIKVLLGKLLGDSDGLRYLKID